MFLNEVFSIYSKLNGSAWCYIQSGIGDTRYEHCPDVKTSLIFPGEKWSFHACTTPSITSEECKFALDQYGKKEFSNLYIQISNSYQLILSPI